MRNKPVKLITSFLPIEDVNTCFHVIESQIYFAHQKYKNMPIRKNLFKPFNSVIFNAIDAESFSNMMMRKFISYLCKTAYTGSLLAGAEQVNHSSILL
jgi:hypothetical protein